MNLSGLKVYETNENELVMEPAFRWAGNPNIVLVLKLLSLRITIQVRNEDTILERKNLFIYMLLHLMHYFQNTDLCLFSVSGFASICSATGNFKASRADFSMFCKHCGVFIGEGLKIA